MIISFNGFFTRRVKIIVYDIALTDYIILDEYVKNTYGNTVYSDHRKIIQDKKSGYGDIPMSEWDIITMSDIIDQTYWRFFLEANAAHFILTMGEMLVKYDYRVEGGRPNVK